MSPRAIELAISLREEMNLTHPPVSSGIVYLCGVRVYVKVEALRAGISGFLYHEGWRNAVIWIESRDSPARQRWTLMHEFAHLFLHPMTLYCAAVTAEQLATEREADIFAAHMLMPEPWLRADRERGLCNPVELARRYQVSPVAMRRRLRELGIT